MFIKASKLSAVFFEILICSFERSLSYKTYKNKTENKTKRYYHADNYTYDEYQNGIAKRNFTDPVRSKLYDEHSKMGAVGPERVEDYVKRLNARKEYIEKNPNLRVLDTSQNKSRGTPSSATRKIIK